ncbi:MAG: DUF2149 domain-containing protein [Firmicutes bacterium]|nr:DUF2149 domain-containing protein [Bacillota bacterium]
MDGGLRNKKRWGDQVAEDVNPLEGVINIADLMLVFACGLMLALAVYWNIELGPIGERIDVSRGQELTDSPELRDDLIETPDWGQLYERLGTVYKDPVSGRLFMLTEE